MATIRKQVSVPANGTIENLLSGSPFEFAGRPSAVSVSATQITVVGGQTIADITFGAEVIGQDLFLSDEVGANQGPKLPDNLLARDVAAGGDRLVVKLRETGGVATLVTALITVEPVI